MKTLKKTLCLVLAVVMVLGVLIIPANAAGNGIFPDEAGISEDYLQAVEALAYLNVLDGKENGFDPQGTLTRAEGATIASRIVIGPDAVLKLPRVDTVYPDVTASHWGAPAIAYATTYGMIGGMEDGKYHPNDQLTTLQFAKMLLVAMGLPGVEYGFNAQGQRVLVSDTFTGMYWTTNVYVKGSEVGLFDDIDNAIDNRVITREEAAQMTLNALTSVVNPLIWNPTTQQWVVDANGALTNTTIAQRVFGMTKFEYEDGDFGRPVDLWVQNGNVVLEYPHAPIATFTSTVSQGDVFAAAGVAGKAGLGGRYIEIESVWNDGTFYGESLDPAVPSNTVLARAVKGSRAAIPFSGKGVTVEVYAAPAGQYRIVVINEYVGRVTKVVGYDEAADNIPYIEITDCDNANFVYRIETAGIAGDFAVNDVVLYTTDNYYPGAAYDVGKAPVASNAKVTAKEGATSFVADGQKYEYSANFVDTDTVQHGISPNDNLPFTDGLSVNAKYNIYTDSCGNAIMIDRVTNPDNENYVFILDVAEAAVGSSGFVGDTTTAVKYIDLDGNIHVDTFYGNVVSEQTPNEKTWGFISADPLHAGCVLFTAVPARGNDPVQNANVVTVNGVTAVRKDTPRFSDGANTVITNDKTVFIITTATGTARYVGIANVPEYTIAAGTVVKGVVKTGDVFAKAVWIDLTNGTAVTTPVRNFVYLIDRDPDVDAGYASDGSTVVFGYDAIVGGKLDMIYVAANTATTVISDKVPGLYEVTYDNLGLVTILTPADPAVYNTIALEAVPAGVKLTVRENVLSTTNSAFAYKLAENVVIHYIQGTTVTEKTMADLNNMTNVTIYAIKTSGTNSVVTELFVGQN